MANHVPNEEFPWADLLGGGQLQHVNLMFAGPAESSRSAQLVLTMLVNAVDQEGKQLFRRAIVLLPPDHADTVSADVVAEMTRKRGTAPDAEEMDVLSRRLIVQRASSLDAIAVLDAVANAPEVSFVAIVDAGRYRPAHWESPPPASLQAPEDRWIAPLADLTRDCISRVASSVCVLLDVGEYLPKLSRNRQAFDELACTVWGTENPQGLDDSLMARMDEWVRRVERGDIVSVLAEVDAQATLSAKSKELCKIQLLYKGGRAARALEILRPLELGDAPVDLKLKLAVVAMSGDDPELARRLLESSAPDLHELDTNELALELSQTLESPAVARQTADWLTQYFPGSGVLAAQQLRRMLRAARDFVLVQPLGAQVAPLDDYAVFITTPLAQAAVPDYVGLVQTADAKWPEHASNSRLAMALNARARGLPLHAATLAGTTDPTSPVARNAANVALWSIEQLLLTGDDFAKETLSDTVVFLLHYLALTPKDTISRERLDELLSVDVSGSVGVALLAHALLRLAAHPQQAMPEPELPIDTPDEAAISAFLDGTAQWLSEQGALNLATMALPLHLLTIPADVALRRLKNTVHYALTQDAHEDVSMLRLMVLMAFAIAPHATRRNDDIEILRLANSRLVLSGQAQMARDLAEAGLDASHGRPERLRLAWYAYGDVYHRTRNYSRALMYFGCALATQSPVELEQAYYETMGIVRALRDTGLLEQAENVLESCAQILRQLDAYERSAHRIETTRLGLRLHALSTARSTDHQAWSALLEAVDGNLQAVILAEDELAPSLVLAVQILRHLDALGAAVDPQIRARIEAVSGGVGQVTTGLVQLAAHEAVGADQLVALTHAAQRTRYADDVGFDVQWLVRAARAQLADAGTREDPVIASFAAELTADHGLRLPGDRDGGWLPTALEDPAAVMQSISRQNVRVEVLALDANQQLVRVSAREGALSVRQEADAFSVQRLHAWAVRFPRAYMPNDDDDPRDPDRHRDDPNLFYTSLQGMGLSEGVGERVVFVMDTQLQRLPPQLLLVDDEMIGRHSAIAVAPSLTWLQAATTGPHGPFGPAGAWISTAARSGEQGTLSRTADLLAPTLEHHAVALSTSAQLPEHLQRAQLAIVAAHGGLADGNRFFQAVSDESKLHANALALAQSLEGAGVVILFVCSGGRQDEHPVASTSVGLPKQLLNRGSLAVIASPWPLEYRFPAYWLPAFLEAWNRDETLLDANAAANREVVARMGGHPKYALAMTLYGNPLLRRRDLLA